MNGRNKLINRQFDENFTQNTYENDQLKEELKNNLKTKEGRQLFQRVMTLQIENDNLRRQHNKSKVILSSIRLNYFKEINNLREMSQPWKNSQSINDYLQVRYF